MRKILITGANGFLAKSIIDFCDAKNSEIIGLVKPGTTAGSKIFSRIYTDLDTLLNDEKDFSTVFHVAAFIPYAALNQPDRHLVDTNILLTIKLTGAFPQARFVYASSTAVYGKPHVLPIEVESPFVNPDLYGLSKLAGETIVKNHPNHAIIRFSSIIGPGLKANSFIPVIIEKALKTGVITILGDGSRAQNYIDVRDAAILCLACAGLKENVTTLGIGSRSYSNKEVAEIVALKTKAQLTFAKSDNSPSFLYNVDSVHKQLNFQPRYSLEQTISEMIQKK
jgi:UDP-glucose 4-epimerase